MQFAQRLGAFWSIVAFARLSTAITTFSLTALRKCLFRRSLEFAQSFSPSRGAPPALIVQRNNTGAGLVPKI